MKRYLLAIAVLLSALVVIAQPGYKPSYFGIKAAVNSTKNVLDPSVSGLETDWKSGAAGGIYYNFGIGRIFSIAPEVLYSEMGSDVKQIMNGEKNDFRLTYVSVPVVFKISPTWRLGIFGGPQFDFLIDAEFKDEDKKDNLKTNDFLAFAGLEFWITKNIGIYGKYMWGLNDINENTPHVELYTSTITSEVTNEGWQAGITIGFKGKLKDTDKDGIYDKDDKCPADIGTPKYNGCPPPDSDSDGVNDEADRCPTQPGLATYSGCPPPDTDGDSVTDDKDKCPSQAGSPKYDGCPVPDTDGDGIDDEADKCPTDAGTAQYAGCPVPDRDKDGVNDENDQCPDQAGTTRYNGCPVPDTDGDGINDDDDRCKDTPGTAEMKGCPKPKYKAQAVTFATGSNKLTAAGRNELNHLAEFLRTYPDAKIILIGHTDTTGSDEVNDRISLERAESSKEYLVTKGIDQDRIAVEGRGSKEPVASNKTTKGRTQNRRIEIQMQ